MFKIKSPATHSKHQKITAIILAIFIAPTILAFNYEYFSYLLILYTIIIYYHAHLGVKVILNDYIKSNLIKKKITFTINIISYLTLGTLIILITFKKLNFIP